MKKSMKQTFESTFLWCFKPLIVSATCLSSEDLHFSSKIHENREILIFLPLKKKTTERAIVFFVILLSCIAGYLAYYLLYPPFTFCFFFNYLRAHVAAAFDLWKEKRKHSRISDSREEVNILFTKRKRRMNAVIFEMKTDHLQHQEV